MQKKSILRKRLTEEGIDGLLITDLVNVRYLSGFTGTSGCLVITKKHVVFMTDFRYEEQAKAEVRGCSVRIESSERSGEIRDICDEYGIRTLGFEENAVTYGAYRKLSKRKIRLRPFDNIVESIRAVKSSKELSCIRTAVSRAEAAFRKLRPHIKAGNTERKIALKLEELLRKEGCKMLPFGVIVASGPMSALPHAQPTDRKLKKGDLVVIDWGGECGGYFSDMTRTLLIRGRDMSRQRELYNIVLQAQERAVRSVQAGVRTAVTDAAARDHITKKGYGEHFGHGTGHGVGLAVHEKPVVSWRNADVIKENMVFTVEPGIYLPGFGGVRIEDMVRAGKSGAEVMTSLPKKLRVIER